VPYPRQHDEPGTADRRSGAPGCGRAQQRVGLAVQHQGRYPELSEPAAVPLRANLAALRARVPDAADDVALDPLARCRLDPMTDSTGAEYSFAAPTGDWLADLVDIGQQARAVMRRHRWLATLVAARPVLGPQGIALLEHVLHVLEPHPASIAAKLEAFAMLNAVTAVFVQNELAGGTACSNETPPTCSMPWQRAATRGSRSSWRRPHQRSRRDLRTGMATSLPGSWPASCHRLHATDPGGARPTPALPRSGQPPGDGLAAAWKASSASPGVS
jgi:hypothetical protein